MSGPRPRRGWIAAAIAVSVPLLLFRIVAHMPRFADTLNHWYAYVAAAAVVIAVDLAITYFVGRAYRDRTAPPE